MAQGRAALLRAVASLRRTEGDLLRLRSAILERLRGTLRFDAYVWLLTDPQTCVGAAPLAEVPDSALPRLPELIRLKYATDVNRWTGIGPESARSLHGVTGGDLSRSLVWREFLHEFDVVDVASAVFRDRYGCWAFLDLWRTGPLEPYTPQETALLAEVAATVTPALRTGQIPLFDRAAGAVPDESRALPGPVVLMLTPQLQVVGQTFEAAEYLRQLVPPAEGQAPVPAAAYNVAAQLLAVEAGVDDHPARARVHLRDGLWLSVRAARFAVAQEQAVDPDRPLAVTLEVSTPAERADLLASVCGFSAREAEVLAALAAGSDTRDTAAALFVSEHTVQDHLKGMFAKAGVRSRRALLARAAGI